MAGITIKGIDELKAKLKKNITLDDVKKVVRQNGAELQRRMVSKADFKKGYATGKTKGSITLQFSDGGFTAEVGPKTEYSEYLEHGTRFMEAQPFVYPAGREQMRKFISDMEKLTK